MQLRGGGTELRSNGLLRSLHDVHDSNPSRPGWEYWQRFVTH